jgi:ABC-type glycerol-3-phosphate transport system permease component
MRQRIAWGLARAALGWLVAGVMAFPVFWMALAAFKTELDAIARCSSSTISPSPPSRKFRISLETLSSSRAVGKRGYAGDGKLA